MTKHVIAFNPTNFLSFGLLSVFTRLVFQLVNCQDFGNECGKVHIPRGLLLEEDQTKKGLWPFAAAIYEINQSKVFCGGTIISHQHVLTAAHCVQDKNFAMKYAPDDVGVLLGAYGLRSTSDPGVIHINVSEINVHPDWKEFNLARYDADIAILLLKDNVTFTNYIRPVCMPADDDIIDSGRGFIVGWNLSQEIPKHSIISVSNDSYCYNNFVSFLSSSRTLCAGGGKGSLITDVSGGGFFAFSGSVWKQYGISVVLTTAVDDSDVDTFVVLTNVKSFKNWIVDTVRQSGGSVGTVDEIKVNFNCKYEELYYSFACMVYGLNVQSRSVAVSSITASHQKVELIQFHNGTMLYLLDGIGFIFPNLKSIHVGYSDSESLGIKVIRRSNFHNMANVFEIVIHKNDIETMDEHIFWDLPKLERFQLDGKLKLINERTFEKNFLLREVYLASNHLESLPRDLFKNNLLLDWANFNGNFLKIIDIDFSTLKNIKYIFLSDNVCINMNFTRTLDSKIDSDQIQQLKEFQTWIINKCSGASS